MKLQIILSIINDFYWDYVECNKSFAKLVVWRFVCDFGLLLWHIQGEEEESEEGKMRVVRGIM